MTEAIVVLIGAFMLVWVVWVGYKLAEVYKLEELESELENARWEIYSCNTVIKNEKIAYAEKLKEIHELKKQNIHLQNVQSGLNKQIEKSKTVLSNSLNFSREHTDKLLNQIEDLKKEITHLKAQLPPVDLGDKTKKQRGWSAAWKVTAEAKKQIIKAKGSQESIAKQFGISRSRVGQIKRNEK